MAYYANALLFLVSHYFYWHHLDTALLKTVIGNIVHVDRKSLLDLHRDISQSVD